MGSVTLLLALAACSADGDAEGGQELPDSTTTTGSVDTTMPAPSESEETLSATPSAESDSDPGMTPLIEMAIEDLSQRTGADRGDVVVLDARLVTWPDSSMGCPEPGKVYLPVLADGSVIELAIGETAYSYHTGGDIYEPFLCEEPSGEEGEASSTNPLAGTPLELDKPIEKYPDETVPPPGYDD